MNEYKRSTLMAPAVFGARSAMATYTIGNRGGSTNAAAAATAVASANLRLTNGISQHQSHRITPSFIN